jgi:hypothetical protein
MGDNARVVGCDLFSTAIASNGASTAGFVGPVYYKQLTPSLISTRLTNLEELFQYYAIRELRICYTNDVGSTIAGSVAIGLVQSADTAVDIGTYTQQQVLELSPSFKTAVWEPESCMYRHTGSRLWNTDKSSAGAAEQYAQAYLVAALNASTLAAATFGTLWLEYVIDFYKPTPVESTPALRIAKLMRQNRISIEQLAASSNLSPPRLSDNPSSLLAAHCCAASSPCMQCGVDTNYVRVDGSKTSLSK